MTIFDKFIEDTESMVLMDKYGLLTPDGLLQKSQELGLKEKIIQIMYTVISDNMSEEEKQQFEKIVERGEEGEIEIFFLKTVQQIPDLKNLMLIAFEKLEKSI